MQLKNLFYLFLIPALTISLVACDSDDDIDTSIIGTWDLEKIDGPYVSSSHPALAEAVSQIIKEKYVDPWFERRTGYIAQYNFTEDSIFRMAFCTQWSADEREYSLYTGSYTFRNDTVQYCITYPKSESLDTLHLGIHPQNGIFKLPITNISYVHEGKISKRNYENYCFWYPEIMKPLANLTNEEIEKLEVYKVDVYMVYRRR